MAELPPKQSEEPMAIGMKVAQPQTANKTKDAADKDGEGSTTSVLASHGTSDPATVERAGEEPADDAGIPVDVKKKKKKRSNRVAKSRRNITGFEEYFADAPMTPAEALEKKQLYDPVRPFPDRIEECIQRFRARRRLDPQRAAMFNKYLFLGGIDASQRQFTGVDRDELDMAQADAEQIRTVTAVDFVGGAGSRFYEGRNSEDWEVDFEAVVKGFLSRTIIDLYMFDEEAIQLAADLVKNFLNYVLMQDACPEFKNNIVSARRICDIAPRELRYTHDLFSQLPGTFNLAARSLFCGGGVRNLDEDENYEALVVFRLTALLSPLSGEAKQIRENILQHEDPTAIKVISTAEQTYQVRGIERPRRKDQKIVEEQLAAMKLNVKLRTAGCIRVVPGIIAHGWGNMPRPGEVDFSNAREVAFLLEDELLAMFEVGMKIHVTACELNIGLHFIKEVHDLRVSFDTFLPQYLMADWKVPVPNERPPPSIHNPNVENKAMGAEMEADD